MAIITLLTDFGTADSYVGEVKGILLSQAPDATLVDISHQLAPGDVRSASYLLGRTWRRFPPGTVHLAVVDPGVGTERTALVLASGRHFFVGPDNGVFTSVFRHGPTDVLALSIPAGASATFHGRDVFAPAAAALANRGWSSSLGTQLDRNPELLSVPLPEVQTGWVEGEVVYVDHFGNLITNLEARHVGPRTWVWIGRTEIGAIRLTFGEVKDNELVAYLGSGGNLEIAVRNGSAAQRLAADVGTRVRIGTMG